MRFATVWYENERTENNRFRLFRLIGDNLPGGNVKAQLVAEGSNVSGFEYFYRLSDVQCRQLKPAKLQNAKNYHSLAELATAYPNLDVRTVSKAIENCQKRWPE